MKAATWLVPLAAVVSVPGLFAADERPINVPARCDGVVLLLGTELKKSEKVPPGEVVTIKVDGQERRFRKLKVGDRVEDGQVIGRFDDRLARLDLAVARAQLAAAAAKKRLVAKMIEEAATRHKNLVEQERRNPPPVRREDMRGAERSSFRSTYHVQAVLTDAEVKVAEANVRRAEALLARFKIRAVRGVVTAIVRRRGEGVHAYETVVRIRPDDKENRP